MRVGELEQLTRLSRDTIRYYERIRLITPPARLANGYRDYSEHTVTELRFIRRAKELGFSLEEIRIAIPMLKGPPPQRCEVLASRIARKRSALLAQIEEAQLKVQRLDELLLRFGGPESLSR
ncbi:MerR family transcriptional regulator [Billgrantia kenyensis]|uniref:MerR family transcriptional regulator n=1 Tax=Billgrantia kenyensis TaxID=321266 RepID=A0A7V9W3H5_9GAMM|nr:MerR family transcriptional regulator [Halomonas kenyensis]MBA2780297.1 MerR family transcriptional regulator [Halomonas kenyensis]MCG6663213.1 MerR family transcriptional regulator [Halomonas kenyensis]